MSGPTARHEFRRQNRNDWNRSIRSASPDANPERRGRTSRFSLHGLRQCDCRLSTSRKTEFWIGVCFAQSWFGFDLFSNEEAANMIPAATHVAAKVKPQFSFGQDSPLKNSGRQELPMQFLARVAQPAGWRICRIRSAAWRNRGLDTSITQTETVGAGLAASSLPGVLEVRPHSPDGGRSRGPGRILSQRHEERCCDTGLHPRVPSRLRTSSRIFVFRPRPGHILGPSVSLECAQAPNCVRSIKHLSVLELDSGVIRRLEINCLLARWRRQFRGLIFVSRPVERWTVELLHCLFDKCGLAGLPGSVFRDQPFRLLV